MCLCTCSVTAVRWSCTPVSSCCCWFSVGSTLLPWMDPLLLWGSHLSCPSSWGRWSTHACTGTVETVESQQPRPLLMIFYKCGLVSQTAQFSRMDSTGLHKPQRCKAGDLAVSPGKQNASRPKYVFCWFDTLQWISLSYLLTYNEHVTRVVRTVAAFCEVEDVLTHTKHSDWDMEIHPLYSSSSFDVVVSAAMF